MNCLPAFDDGLGLAAVAERLDAVPEPPRPVGRVFRLLGLTLNTPPSYPFSGVSVARGPYIPFQRYGAYSLTPPPQRRPLPAQRTSVRHTDACHSQGAQGTDREPPKLAHVRQPITEVINPAWGLLARSKRGTRPMPVWLFGGTRQRRIQFCASGWEETKEGAAVWWHSPDDRTWL